MIGETGPCHGCGVTVTVFPPSTHLQPPHIGMAALFGALLAGTVFLVVFLSLRTIPMIVSLQASMVLTTRRVFGELAWTLGTATIGAAIGALFFGMGAALLETRRSFHVLRRGIAIGGVFGLLLGGLIGSLNNGPGVGPQPFFVTGESIAIAMVCAGAVCAAVGGLIAVPIAVNRERRLVRKASFTAPALPGAPLLKKKQEQPAEVVPKPAGPRPELSTERRQELIKRLGVVREQAGDEPDDEDRAPA